VGLLSGWLLPYLLYFRDVGDSDDDDGDRETSGLPSTGIGSGVFSPWANPSGAGLSYSALF